MGQLDDRDENDFEAEARKKQTGQVGELWSFLRHNKKWWLAPIVVILFLVGVLAMLGSTSAAPFIYTLF